MVKPLQLLALTASLTTLLLGPVARSETVAYEYDSTGRLIAARFGSGLQIHYLYDAAGNLLAKRFQTFIDSDGDAMDDAWETSFFGNLSRTGLDDFDQDGAIDRNEFFAGTNPTSNASVLKVTRIIGPAGDTATIEWQSVTGKRYRVQYKDKLSNPTWTDLSGDVTASGPTATKTDASVPEERLYRVSLVP